ncbi:MAG TPA: tectonin domain-containing protein [Bryobacteraceae bacterium]|jgi:hypothetical protein|nr:tectonin domain-containing protein [Bryobacteraceae bacterium]
MRLAFFVLLASPGLIFAFQPPSRIAANIDTAQTFALAGNVRPVLARAQDQGAADPALLLPRITLHLAMTAAQKTELLQLLADQQTHGSARWHQWLTPEQYADRFGVDPADIQKIVTWLQDQGFSNVEVARSRTWVSFSGTAAQAGSAFQTSIHRYLVNGQTHYANATAPMLPKGLDGMVESIRGLHDFHPQPRGVKARSALQAHFTSSISGNHFLVPDDWATIYDVKPLYANGIDGTGVKIAIPGQSDIVLSDIEAFRTAAGLPKNDPQVILSGSDPGTNSGDESESDLDIEWAGGIAKNATVIFVNSTDAFGSATYAVDNNVAPVLSITYGNCEQDLGTAEIDTLTSLFQQANAEGITVLAASGDQGAADCENSNAAVATQGLAVDVPAAIPYVTGLGGTELNEGSGTYWSSTNNANSGSALSYIPEIAWNDTSEDGQLSATGGGKSTFFTKPAWQTGSGIPYDGARDVPDLAFAASPDHDGFLICSAGSCVNGFRMTNEDLNVIGGTSAAAPSFAAVIALLNQQTGDRQGNINPALYALASVSTDAFHDVTSGSNIVPCQQGSSNCAGGTMGYSAGKGYDLVTGWGSVNAYNLLREWSTFTPAALTEMPGGALQLAVGADGTVWGLNVNGESYSYNAQTNSWTSGSQPLSQIAVGASGAIWGLNSAGDIYRFNSTSKTWRLVPGNLSQLAVGADGAVWGLNAAGSIYTFNSQTQSFTQIPGVLSQIVVGFDGAVWGLNASEQVYRFNPGTQSFDYVAGSLAQLSVGADGAVWGINYLGNIYYFDRLTQGWSQTPGSLKAISAGSGSNVWGLNPESDLFHYNSAEGTWNELGEVWRSLTASANGSVWGVDYSGQSYQLVQATQAYQSWHQLPGTLVKIAVSSDGDIWGINAGNQVYTFNAITQSWTLLPGDLSQIAVAANGAVWGINGSGGVFRFNASTQQFALLPGNLSQIAVADTGAAWGINTQGQIYQFDSSSENWNLIPGTLSQISVGVDGDAWGVDSQDTVYHFNTQTQSWTPVNGSLSQISAGSSSNVWGLDANGYVYRYNALTQAFDLIPGILAHIAVAFDGTVWGINSGQQVYRFDSQTQNWVNIPGALTTIAIGSDAVVWGINSGGGIYRFE